MKEVPIMSSEMNLDESGTPATASTFLLTVPAAHRAHGA